MRPLPLAPLAAAALASLIAVASTARAQEEPDTAARPAPPPTDPVAGALANSGRAGAVIADSLYGFAVRAADHARESYVYLLDAEWVRREADGREARTIRQVVQILNPTAIGRWANLSVGYNAERQTLTVDHARVVRPGGEVLSAAPSIDRESDVAPAGVDPVFDRTRARRLVLAKVAAGTIVDYEYTIRETAPPLAGDFAHSFRIAPGPTVVRSYLELDLPADVRPQIVARGLGPEVAATTSDSAGRRRWRWASHDVSTRRTEPFTPPDLVGRGEEVRVGGGTTWADVGRWFAGETRDRAAVTPEVEAKLREVTAGAHTLTDSLRAVHRYVSGDLRYVSVALGRGAYQPRLPRLVVETGYGDCKDKAMLFIAAARRWGVEAYPVLLSAGPSIVPAELATAHAFNHLIVALHEPGAPKTAPLHFVDLTAAYVPYDELPTSDQGQFALVVRPDGRADTLHLPVADAASNVSAEVLVATIDTAGRAVGHATITERGSVAPGIRAALWSAPDATRRAALGQSLAQGIVASAVADSVVLPDARDLAHVPALHVTFHDGVPIRRSGSTGVLSINFSPNGGQFATKLAELTRAATAASSGTGSSARRAPIDARQLVPAPPAPGSGVQSTEYTLTLPEGWKADLPRSVDLRTDFAQYTATYEQHGRVLHVLRRAAGRGVVLPPERIGDVRKFLDDAAKDDATFVVVHTSDR